MGGWKKKKKKKKKKEKEKEKERTKEHKKETTELAQEAIKRMLTLFLIYAQEPKYRSNYFS